MCNILINHNPVVYNLDKEDCKESAQKYRLMIYFAHSTMVIYSADIICDDKMTAEEFRKENEAVCKRVFDEGLSIMNYELSWEQMNKAILVYLQSKFYPTSVKTSEVFKPEKNES